MDKPSTTKTKTPSKSQLIVLSPDVLKKLGIASQLSKLTTSQKSTDVPSTNNTKKSCIENEIKQRLLSQSLHNVVIKSKIITNSAELANQINLTDSNKCDAELNKHDEHATKSVLNEVIRKSDRKRKISSVLGDYVTELKAETTIEARKNDEETIEARKNDGETTKNNEETEEIKNKMSEGDSIVEILMPQKQCQSIGKNKQQSELIYQCEEIHSREENEAEKEKMSEDDSIVEISEPQKQCRTEGKNYQDEEIATEEDEADNSTISLQEKISEDESIVEISKTQKQCRTEEKNDQDEEIVTEEDDSTICSQETLSEGELIVEISKKRGRPKRKDKHQSESIYQYEEKSTKEEEEVADSTFSSQEKLFEDDSFVEISKSLKRGRPKRKDKYHKEIPTEEDEAADSTFCSQEKVSEDESIVEISKKRGRPKGKNKHHEEIPTEEDEAADSTFSSQEKLSEGESIVEISKKRGRPKRKNKHQFESFYLYEEIPTEEEEEAADSTFCSQEKLSEDGSIVEISKKRGRPKGKNKHQEEIAEDDEAADSTFSSQEKLFEDDSIVEIRKSPKRGRPKRKDKHQSEYEEIPTEEEEAADSTLCSQEKMSEDESIVEYSKSKRGRLKRKNRSESIEEIPTEEEEAADSTFCSQEKSSEDESLVEISKKRGRPKRKIYEHAAEESIIKYEDDSECRTKSNYEEEILRPQKRGRPKGKKKQYEEIKVEEDSSTRRRSGRPRKEKKLQDAIYYDTPRKHIDREEKRKRRRPQKQPEETEEEEETTNNNEEEEIRNTGRRKISESDDETLKHRHKLVECGVCHEVVDNTLWTFHSAKHNYLCWRVGELPIDLNNRKLCETILLKVALTKKVLFVCEKCGEKRRSAIGYFSHVDLCQKTEEERLAMRVACPECYKLMQPCSLKNHMRNHLPKNTTIHKTDIQVEEDDGVRRKRNAAKKAQGLINEFTKDDADNLDMENEVKRLYKKGSDECRIFSNRKYNSLFHVKLKKMTSIPCNINNCQYIGSDFKEMKQHIENCPELRDDDYICFACFFVTVNEAEMKKHVLVKHLQEQGDQEFNDEVDEVAEEEEEEDEDVSCNEDEDMKKKKPPTTQVLRVNSEYARICNVDKIKFLAYEMRVPASRNCTYPAAAKWTKQFQDKNYSLEILFPYQTNWIPIDDDQYLPVTRQSLCVRTILASKTLPDLQGEDHEWKQFQLFETELSDDTVTIFCGGPVWELAWLPTPYHLVVDQILAVSVQRDFNETFKTSQSYASPQIVQFWNFGKLNFEQPIKNVPKLEFSLAHDHGNVWCMEWCPSGCYDESGRLGLLALACSDGNIPIYSISLPANIMVKAIECFKLVMQNDDDDDDIEHMKLGNWDYQCTKLNWSKIKGHSVIAAGYSNGMVCMYDLNNTSPLIKKVNDQGTVVLLPYFSFQPHTAAITALQIYPLGEKVRWLLTGAWDRNSFIWDLEQPNCPVFVFSKRGNVSDGVMLNHWLCAFISYDDVHFLEHTTTSIQNVRDFGFKNSSLMSANSMVMGLSASDWANAIAQVTLAGELCCTFQRQLIVGYDVDKGSRCKRFLLTYNEAIDKHLDAAQRKEKFEKKKKDAAARSAKIPEKLDKNFFRYLVSKENEPYDDEPKTYTEASQKYGIVFCDINLNSYEKMPPDTLRMVKTSGNMKDAPPEMYPILAQNRVRWNPNKQAYLHICSGYHSGFVRLRCVRFMHSKFVTHIK